MNVSNIQIITFQKFRQTIGCAGGIVSPNGYQKFYIIINKEPDIEFGIFWFIPMINVDPPLLKIRSA